MNERKNESNDYPLYSTFVDMSGMKKDELFHQMGSELSAEGSDADSLSESERNVLLSRIAGQLGIDDASKLPYAAGLNQ